MYPVLFIASGVDVASVLIGMLLSVRSPRRAGVGV
jgi:hypothetical protein